MVPPMIFATSAIKDVPLRAFFEVARYGSPREKGCCYAHRDAHCTGDNLAAGFAGALEEYRENLIDFPLQQDPDFANAKAHSELLFRKLQSIPASRDILRKINDRFIENMFDSGIAPAMPEIYDAWGTAIDYQYMDGWNFPLLISAGPDKQYGTADDITNR